MVIKLEYIYLTKRFYFVFRHLSDTDLLTYLVQNHNTAPHPTETGKYLPVRYQNVQLDDDQVMKIRSRLNQMGLIEKSLSRPTTREEMWARLELHSHAPFRIRYIKKTVGQLKEEDLL